MKKDYSIFLYLQTETPNYDDDFENEQITKNFDFWLQRGIRPIVGDETSDDNNYWIVTKVDLHQNCIHITLKEI